RPRPPCGGRAAVRVGAQSGAERGGQAGLAPRSGGDLRGGARAERIAGRGGAAEHHPPGRRRGAGRERQLVTQSADFRARQAAAAALAGTDLDPSQREACAGLLTSARLINCLVAPAGTGKTRVVAAFARIWTAETGGRVIGLTASTNAARVMAAEAEEAAAPM